MNHKRSVSLAVLLGVALVIGLGLKLGSSMTRVPTTIQSSSRASTSSSSSSTEIQASSSTLQQSSTSGPTGVIIPSSSASTLDSLTGLSLNLNLSTNSNGWVVVTSYEFNTLDTVNNVSVADSWPSNTSLFQWVQRPYDDNGVAGFEILQGDYGLNNFTQGTALWLQPEPSVLGCCAEVEPPDSYTFKPLSEADVAYATNVGFWAGGTTYTQFALGTYTVLAGDQWGNVVILHFAIQD